MRALVVPLLLLSSASLFLSSLGSIQAAGGFIVGTERGPWARAMSSGACRAGYRCERIQTAGCVRKQSLTPIVRRLPLKDCTAYSFAISLEAAYNGSRVWIDLRSLRCPARRQNPHVLAVHDACSVQYNGGTPLGFATVATYIYVAVKSAAAAAIAWGWRPRYAVVVLFHVDVHGRVNHLKILTPTGCPPQDCLPQ